MPQMQPINWLLISLISIIILAMIINIIYFNIMSKSSAPENNEIMANFKPFNFKW